jgi:pilus assembly protein CpaB
MTPNPGNPQPSAARPLPPPPAMRSPSGGGGGSGGWIAGLAIGLGLTVVLGLVVMVVGYSWVKKKEADVRRGWNLVPVVVAATDIPEGTVVTFDMISQRQVPEQFVTSSVVKPDSANYVVNQKVLVPLQAGDLLLWSEFETTKAAEKLATKVPDGYRLFAVAAPRVAAAGGWIRPNDHVDVVAVFPSSKTKEQVARTVLQGVTVFATGRITASTNVNLVSEDRREYEEVTLLVDPAQAEKLALFARIGALSLALRNPNDKAEATSRPELTVAGATAP